MARTIYVKKARKDQQPCMSPSCKHTSRAISAGMPYKHFSMKLTYGGVRKVYHEDCHIPQSHRTTSRMGEIYDAQEEAENAMPQEPDETGTLETIASDFAQTVREVGEGYTESADNMEEGFGHSTFMSDELREKGESLEEWANDLESLDFEEFDEVEAREQARNDSDLEDGDEDTPEVEEAVEEARSTWWEEQVEKLNSELGNCPV